MILRTTNITARNPDIEIWRFLRLYLDRTRTEQRIREVHSLKEDEQSANVRKQAVQVGYCLRQGEQYFKAADVVGLATRPVLLYYGTVSLTRALILVKKDGTYSLDASRQAKKHNHHGLQMAEGILESCARAKSLNSFLQGVECFLHKKSDGSPWGHFPLLHESLSPEVISYQAKVRDTSRIGAELLREEVQNCVDPIPLTAAIFEHLNMYELVRALPDLYDTLRKFGIPTLVKFGTLERTTVEMYRSQEIGGEEPPKTISVLDKTIDDFFFSINHLTAAEKEHLKTVYRKLNSNILVKTEYPSNVLFALRREFGPNEEESICFLPDLTEDTSGKKFFLLHPDRYLNELSSFLATLFSLSMLARYYPDVWMKAIGELVDVSEFMAAFLSVAARKIPNLVLDQLSGVKHFVHV